MPKTMTLKPSNEYDFTLITSVLKGHCGLSLLNLDGSILRGTLKYAKIPMMIHPMCSILLNHHRFFFNAFIINVECKISSTIVSCFLFFFVALLPVVLPFEP